MAGSRTWSTGIAEPALVPTRVSTSALSKGKKEANHKATKVDWGAAPRLQSLRLLLLFLLSFFLLSYLSSEPLPSLVSLLARLPFFQFGPFGYCVFVSLLFSFLWDKA